MHSKGLEKMALDMQSSKFQFLIGDAFNTVHYEMSSYATHYFQDTDIIDYTIKP